MHHRMLRRAAALLVGIAAACSIAVISDAGAPASVEAQPAGGGAEVDADFHTLRTPPLADGQFELLTVSTMPDTVTGGDVTVAIRGLGPVEPVMLKRNGEDVTRVLERRDDGELRGLVTGLVVGENRLVARSGKRRAVLTVRNHPVTGPVISGPHQEPFECRTEEAGLGAPIDDDCSVEPTSRWFYRSLVDQSFHELADLSSYPADVMTTETSDGRAVPFVVRVESRTINRGITRIATLDDPASRADPMAFDAANFNGRVYQVFGESCGVGYQQGVNDPEMVLGAVDLTGISADRLLVNLVGASDWLGDGYATVHSTLAAFGNHCNPLVSAETTMMIKEHISEQYAPVEAVVGTNGSGAALQQYSHINNMPGLLGAAMPTATFTDIPSTAMTVADCGLLQRYYEQSGLTWNDVKQAEVNGHNLLSGNQLNAICQSWVDTFLDRLDPTTGCSVSDDERYDPERNPDGVRCTIQDANVNIFGVDPETGFANRPLDNVGVQYGLEALQRGVITPEEFVDLNVNVGGYDIDGNWMPERHEMSSETAATTYRIGGVVGRGAIAETPVMDLAPYLDLIPVANIHESVRPFQIRDRLRTQTGQDATQSIWRGVVTQADALDEMDDWLTATQATRPEHGGDHVAAVTEAKPASAGDRCAFGTIGGRLDLSSLEGPLGLFEVPLLPGSGLSDLGLPLRVDVPEDFDSGLGPCSLLLPVVSTPRGVAGMPLSDDVIKCQLRPFHRADYPAAMSDEQFARLVAAFPDGVCDYTKPAAEDVAQSMLWPSVGGDELHEPRELRWRVARSTPTAAPPPRDSHPVG